MTLGNTIDVNWRVVTPVGPELPSLPERYVPRPRLERRLGEAVAGHRVVAMVAPAVSGKTTLVAGWSAGPDARPLAYVALDTYDNEGSRFCSKVVGALQHVHPGFGATALAELTATGDPRRFLDMLLPELSGLGPTVVVLDGLEAVTSPEVNTVVGDILVGLPDTIRVVLCSRSEPLLRLGLLRARGQLAEIPARDLAFDVRETASFLATFDTVGFGPDETLALHERTEGWAGGVRLAALAAADHADPLAAIRGFSGSNRYVADLLGREVLETQDPEVREFLLVTSVLRRLDTELCDLVTGTPGSGAVLEGLERAGMFVEALDDERTRFRCAPLFREFLQREIHVLDPQRERAAHRVAAGELEERGDVTAAIDHYVAAGQETQGVRLVLEHGQRYAGAGEVEVLRTWLTVLPDHALTGDVHRMLEVGRLCLVAGLRDDAAMWLERARLRLDEADDPELVARHALFVGYAHAQMGDLESAASAGHRVLTVAEAAGGDVGPWLRARGHHLIGASCAALDEFEAARRHRAAAPEETRGEVPTASYSAWLCYREGRLDRAVEHADRLLEDNVWPWQWSSALTARAGVLRERDQLDEAEEDLGRALELARRWHRPRVTVLGSIELALTHYARGRATAAFEVLAAARHDVHGDYIGQRLQATEAGLWLREGDLDRYLTVRQGLPASRLTTLLDIRAALAGRRHDEAQALVAANESGARSVRDRISLRLLYGQALLPGDVAGARDTLRWAVDIGRRERFVQVYVEDLGPLHDLLRDQSSQGDDPYVFALMAAMAQTQEDAPGRAHITESLSSREQIVLRYLPTNLSNKRIATELHMSVNTLKTHLKSVYRKLGVGSREEAVSHARHLRLL
jgi:LuxR family maltose regulon positive regulatory protein